MNPRPELLSTRVAHQYRRRDVLAYVSLRHYLRSRCTVRDLWGRNVTVQLVLDRKRAGYHEVLAFKERAKDGVLHFRPLHLPGPTEMLAEAAMLEACAEAGGAFSLASSVFSYVLASGEENDGIFRPYFPYFTERHKAIAAACRKHPNAVVVYTDIRKYYPSIGLGTAEAVWDAACRTSRLPARFTQLGRKLLADYRSQVQGSSGSLLTGPMFCHLIGNLVLGGVDREMSAIAPGRYFRYVDDIALVESPDGAGKLEQHLTSRLGELGLKPNDSKRMEVGASDWLRGEDDFSEPSGPDSWPCFVGSMKQLLLRDPEQVGPLAEILRAHELRIVPLDYSEVVQERGYLQRIDRLMRRQWFRRKLRKIEATAIAEQGIRLRTKYFDDFHGIVQRFVPMSGYERKRHLHRLRFLLSRLVYIASNDELALIADQLQGIHELALAEVVFRAIAMRDVSALVAYGASAAQAAAQPLRAIGGVVACNAVDWQQKPVSQAVAILRLNGVQLSRVDAPRTELVQFCDWADDSEALLRSQDPYMEEIGFLHGKGEKELNAWALSTAFDRDEEMVFDMQDMLEGSS